MSMIDGQLDLLSIGRERRDEGMNRALTNSDDAFKLEGARIIRSLAASRLPFNADDVRGHLEDLGIPIANPNSVGGLFAAASRNGLIVRTGGTRQTTSVSQHAHTHPLWIGTT